MLHLIKTLSSLFFLFTFFIQADVIDITLIDNPPYFTDELSRYLTTVSNDIEPCVGFNAINIGDGKGDGHNEIIAFSFIFQPLTEIETAYLILDITPRGTSTDELLFADNWSIRGAGVAGERYYGNTILRTLPNIRALVTFDLKHISFCDPSMEPVGFEDISYLLCHVH